MGETVIEKIIRNNVGHAVTPGDIVTVNVDRVMIHDIFIPFVATTRSPSVNIPPARPQHSPHPGCVIIAPASARVSRIPSSIACL